MNRFRPVRRLLVAASTWGAFALAASTCRPAHAAPLHTAPQFRLALPGYSFQFPRDHGAHSQFATEWWYYTGHLRAQNGIQKGRIFGYQLTFFRTSLSPVPTLRASKWATNEIIFAHFALTDEHGQRFFYDDRISRAAVGIAGAQIAQEKHAPRIWLGDWNLQFQGNGQGQNIRARGQNRGDEKSAFALNLTQRALKTPTIHGINGVSQKSAGIGRASHYYSFTRLQSSGTISIGAQKWQVLGQSWFDHEFGSSQLAPNQVGWDWFSLQLSDGRELMLYQLRLKNGGTDANSSGTLTEKNGRSKHLRREEFQIIPTQFWRSPSSSGNYPASWTVLVPTEKLTLQIVPALANQELNTRRSTGIAYWEGLVRATGQSQNRAISATGYVELTGYAKPFGGTF